MPNPVVDPGFELNDPSWDFLAAAERRDDLGAHGGDWAAYLFAQRSDFLGDLASTLYQESIPIEAGERRVLTFWYRCASPGPTSLRATIVPGGVTPWEYNPPTISDWTLYVGNVLDVEGSDAELTFHVPIPVAEGSGYWQIDDVGFSLESDLGIGALVQRGKFVAYSALQSALRGINGSTGGYYFDLATRVQSAWEVPDEKGDRVFTPYLCMPFDGDTEQIEVLQRHVYKATWRQRVYGYVHETSSELSTANSIEELCHLRDDILRALMEDATFGGVIRESSIAGIETNAGLGLGYGALVAEIVFTEWFTRDQLGPLGD